MRKLASQLSRLTAVACLASVSSAMAVPIHEAAAEGNLAEVERLLDQGVEVDVRDERGATALHWAAGGDHAEIAELLLARDASVNTPDSEGLTPLHAAASMGSASVAGILIDQGAEIETRTDYGQTPLHFAAMFASTAVAQLLIDNGADVNAEEVDGMTPLNYAVSSGDPEIAALLRAHGAELVPVCVTREDIEEMNRGAARLLFVLRDLDARVFIALDPRLTGEFADAFDALMTRDIDEIVVFVLTNVPGEGLAAAVPFSAGCVSEGYGEPDMRDKIELMREGVNRISRSGVEDRRVRAILLDLWVDERPLSMTDEEFENRIELQLDRVRQLLEAQPE